jgi:hypothetical protein
LTASAQAEEKDGHQHKQESAQNAQVRKQPIHQYATLKYRGLRKAKKLSQGVEKLSTSCVGKKLLNKPFSDHLHLQKQNQLKPKKTSLSRL